MSKDAITIMQTKMIIPRMNERGISQYRLAQLTGLAESTLSRWFSGKIGLSLENFLKVLTALEINIHLVPKEADPIKYKNRIFFN